MDNTKKLLSIMSETLNIHSDDINESTDKNNSKNWDSFTHLALVAELEDAFKIEFATSEIEDLTSFTSIKNSLQKHGIDI